MLRLLSERDETVKLSGIDPSENMLKVADEKLHGRVELVLGQRAPAVSDGSFDVVYCNDSLSPLPPRSMFWPRSDAC